MDDNDCIRDFLKELLSIFGYHVVEATNGQEAVEIAQRECPDLIFMDLNMPVLDGFAATRRIRETQGICEVPIVACTSNNMSDYRDKALAVGFNEYITKPVDFAQLNTVLHQFLKAA
ncbi:MAG TPA: response regulator [Pyrinomonadaceae bacterium]|nr:response regulator [Pyrinomonadaceae bacterium]